MKLDYENKIIGNVYKLLPIYENCVEISDLDSFERNLSLTISKIEGHLKIQENTDIYEILCLLKNLEDIGLDVHGKVKKIVFECIRLIKKVG